MANNKYSIQKKHKYTSRLSSSLLVDSDLKIPETEGQFRKNSSGKAERSLSKPDVVPSRVKKMRQDRENVKKDS